MEKAVIHLIQSCFNAAKVFPKSWLNEDGMYVNDIKWKSLLHWSYPQVSALGEKSPIQYSILHPWL